MALRSDQRSALLTIYANLDPELPEGIRHDRDEDETTRQRGKARASFYEMIRERVDDGIIRESPPLDPPRIDGVLAEALVRLEDPFPNVLVDDDIELGGDREDEGLDLTGFILEVDVVEALLALARWYIFGPEDEERFATEEALQEPTRRVLTHPSLMGLDLEPEDFLVEIHRAAWDDLFLDLAPRWYGHSSLQPIEPIGPAGDPWRTIVHLIGNPSDGSATPGQALIRDAMTEFLESQPGLRCQAQLLPIDVGGEGEFAVFIRTDVELNQWPPIPCTEAEFVAELFDPETWPSRHDLWCSMEPYEGDVGTLPDDLKNTKPLPPPPGYKFGEEVGQEPKSFDEEVGSCDSAGGSFPNTVLVFADSRILLGSDVQPEHDYFLEYRLHQGQPNASLARDDGVVHVSNHHDRNPRYRFITTKLVYVYGTATRSEGQILAEFACVAGWAEQTRRFLLTCGQNHPGGGP